MGNASSLFDGSYEVGEAFPELTSDGERKQGWTLQLAEDSSGRRVSIFLYPTGATNVEYVDNAVKHFKMLRHPGIPKFLDTKRHTKGCMIVTEKIIPLESMLQKLTPSEICAGLYNIVEVVAFLHDRGGVCHNNICLSSIFVGSNGRWMLGGLEYMCQFDEATATYLNKCKSLRNQNSLAPEEKDGIQVQKKYGHARDIYAFGVLAENLLTYLDDLGDSTKTFELRIQDELLNRDPSVRPCVSTLLEDRLFKIDYLEIINFLRDITLKTEDEKKSFFGDAARKLYNLPSTLITTRLVRPLLSRFVLLDSTATACLIPHLLTPYKGSRESDDFKNDCVNPLLPEESFQRYVIPELFRVFHVYNVHIRLTLLRQFEAYVHLFDTDTLQDFIFPQILVGLRDSCDELVAASLRAVACLVPILGGNVVMGGKREKVFSGTTPDFSEKRNHVQKNNTDVMEKTNSNGMIGNRGDDAASPKEDRRKLREQRREERRCHREKEKNLAKASKKQIKDDKEHSNERHMSDSICSSHDAVEEDTSDSDDAVADYDYDKEIEEELEAMDSAVSPRRDHDIVTGPAVTVDWSDIKTMPTRTKNHNPDEKGALRLKSHWGGDDKKDMSSKDSVSKSGRENDSDAEISDVGTGWSDATDEGWDTTEGWEDVSTISQHPSTRVSPAKLSYPLKSKDKKPGQKMSPSKLCPDAALGAEFDVMAIEVPRKTKSATADPIEQLFAEMQPTIASSGGGLLGMLGNSGVRSGVQSQADDKYKKKASSLFAANDIPDADSDGWGNDLNWNIPDD